jgi:translation elongation factor EF-1alpha
MTEEEVGTVVKFFSKPGVAAVEVAGGGIEQGDSLRFKGHTTEFTDIAASMQIDNQPVVQAKAGDLIGIKVKEKVREGDKVYKVVD